MGYHGRTSGFADLDSAGLADSPSTSILLWAACGVSTSMAEAIARATAERSSLSGGVRACSAERRCARRAALHASANITPGVLPADEEAGKFLPADHQPLSLHLKSLKLS